MTSQDREKKTDILHKRTSTAPSPLYKEMDLGLLRLSYPLIFLIAALLLKSIALQVLILIPLLIILSVSTPKQNRRKLARRIALTLIFISLGTIPILLTSVKVEEHAFMRIGSWGITEVSLQLFALVSLRCVNGFMSILLITTTAPIYSIMHKLRNLRVPPLFIELSELIYRYINRLQETALNIYTAQRSRLGYVGWSNRFEDAGMLFAQTFILAHNDAEKVYKGLLSRGYDEGNTGNEELLTKSDSEVILSLQNITFGYEKSLPILRNISIDIHRCERIVVMGENGAGKSTLFQIFNGINIPQEGTISAFGKTIKGANKHLRQLVGVVFQNPNHQLFTPSVGDEIAFGLKNLGFKGEALQNRVDEVLREFEIETLIKYPPHLLSEGQKKWVAIASVVAMSPEIIILDEPTAGLDRYYTEKIRSLLNCLHEDGKTIILSTHDMEFAYAWADRSIILNKGKVIADAETSKVFEDTTALYEANLRPPRLTPAAHPTQRKRSIEVCPIFLSSPRHRALIVGGGQGAYRKALTLSQHDIPFDTISPTLCEDFQALIRSKGHKHLSRIFIPGDTWRYTLVVAATGVDTIDSQICDECSERNILVNNLSDKNKSTFSLGASSSTTSTTFAIQTKYGLPEIGQALRDKCETYLDKSLDKTRLEALSKLRRNIRNAQKEGNDELYLALKERYEAEKKEIIDQL